MLEKNKAVEDLLTTEDVESAEGAKQSSENTSGYAWTAFRTIMQLVLMAVILGGAYTIMERMRASKPEVPQRRVFPTVYTVETIIAEARTHQPLITLYGEVMAGRSVELRSLVSGPVVAVNENLKVGSIVEKGSALVEIDGFAFEGALREAEANKTETNARIDENLARIKLEQSRLSSARDQLELARSDLARIKQLRQRGTATEKQVEERELILSQRAQSVEQSEINIIAENAKLAQLQATLERLEWKIEESQRALSDTVLRAPFTGTIRSSGVEIGKVVGANDVVVSMYQSDNLEVRFVLTDERFGRLQSDSEGLIGRPLEVAWNVGGRNYVFEGRIDRIGAEIASSRGGIEVYAALSENAEGVSLRPGAFVEVRIPDRAFNDHFRIPGTSVYDGNTVYAVVDNKLESRPVEISSYDGEFALVASGIKAGDEILTTRISEISSGLRVRKEGDPLPQRKQGDNSGEEAAQAGD